jgi:YD repeat-containing protein
LVADPNAYLIGFTDADMYLARYKWNGGFTLRDRPRTAVISSDGQQNNDWNSLGVDGRVSEKIFQNRLKRILLKDVAILYWHLPLNNDPASLLQDRLDPDIPVEDIYESDLEPEQTRWGRYESDPCVFLEYSAKDGMRALPGGTIQDCNVPMEYLHDESIEVFKVYLHQGLLFDLHTDFNLPDVMPIQFQRETGSDWTMPSAFGISGSHNYDSYLTSKDMSSITLRESEYGYTLDRTPRWLPALPLVKYVDADFSGRYYALRWYAMPFEHFELKRFDGETQEFLPCDDTVLCYLIGDRNPQGREIKFQRDSNRRLTSLTSPNKRSLSIEYGAGNRISQITDDQNRKVVYSYSDRGQLVRVDYPTGEVLTYTYDNAQHLLTFSASSSLDSPAVVMLRNEYVSGRLSKQTLADGKMYLYSYEAGDSTKVNQAFVTSPDGTRSDVSYLRNGAAIRSESAEPR